ncbi:MAG: hypothetical protein FWB87_10905 [Defluviitaleaceae bacterium]|nr:hypothetical protein [Defluviitaleaceae bacterium]MCL2261965.1 hypothetical protein [Defluviitaleaceae bacterium]
MTFNDAMNAVLQTRRYDRLTGRTRNLREMIIDQLNRLIDSILNRFDFTLPQGTGDGRIIPLLFAIVGGILVLASIFVLVRIFLQKRKPKTHDLSDIFEELRNRDYTVSDLLSLSDNATDRRTAIRYRYIAALLSLNEQALIHISPSATNAVILRQLKQARSDLASPFTDMANTYHLAWYGYKEISDDILTHYHTAGEKLYG